MPTVTLRAGSRQQYGQNMRIHLILALLFLILAIMAFGAEVLMAFRAGEYAFLPLGDVWFMIDPASLNAAQAAVQRYLLPFLWDPVIVFVLRQPVWTVPLVLAVLFFLLDLRARGRRRKIFK